ncbi:hypothetical protein PanWU01x14_166280 [Parasponia andersonii]|uniref:Uncharacterized protein n=1 Tax=Parasponia andersonii TaxID=3476 RepID=A0A2P5CBH6_PARAD|nr:hypothetical protein PanWU01x14_166280 [Parasponia andersonii]
MVSRYALLNSSGCWDTSPKDMSLDMVGWLRLKPLATYLKLVSIGGLSDADLNHEEFML